MRVSVCFMFAFQPIKNLLYTRFAVCKLKIYISIKATRANNAGVLLLLRLLLRQPLFLLLFNVVDYGDDDADDDGYFMHKRIRLGMLIVNAYYYILHIYP